MPVDPISLEVFKNMFISVAEEMGVALQRTSYSPNIKERRDFSCAIFDPQGQMVAQAAHVPVHLGAMPASVQAALDTFPSGLRPGDMVKIDLEADAGGYVADAARTVVLPPVSTPDLALARCARSACHTALRVATAGNGVREIGKQVEREVTRNGFSVIPQLTGHGVGRRAHEPPTVPNFDDPDCRDRLHEGLMITVEPVISRGSGLALETGDGWTVKTLDGSRSAHHEETIVNTLNRPILLTTICPA